jgi:pilus assembly protein CpaF
MISELPTALSDVTYRELKTKLHTQILQDIDLESVNRLSDGVARERVGLAIRDMLNRERTPLASAERECVLQEVLDEVFGLGPLEPLLADGTVSDILVNGAFKVYIERRGKLELTRVRFDDESHLMRIIDRIVSKVGRRIDESTPMVDARLTDGSRVNVIIPPLSLDGPIMSIRRFGKDRLTAERLLANQTIVSQMLEMLEGCIKGKLNVMISGGTGAGKTTLLNILSGYIPDRERVVTIEDAAELQLRQPHVVRLETRPANIEGKGAIRQRQLVVNALRMRPDRIVVGEVRGEEAVDMLQAMNTGHEGSLTTIHANTPRDAITRLETMIAMANLNLPEHAVRQQIASAINVIVQVSRMPDGTRKIISITEVTGMEGPQITTQDIFVFKRAGVDQNNKVTGRFQATGIRPKFTEKLQAAGIVFDLDTFMSDKFMNGK